MSYFAMQYQILFHDTMAYGPHHHMTNLKFQNIARETLLFGTTVSGKSGWEEQLKDIVILTREAYSLNLSPVKLSEKVGILLTYEDSTHSTVRLCFRVIKCDGQPVSCGYQTMILLNKDTHELVPAPPLMSQYLDPEKEYSLLERLTNPSFAQRLKHGGKAIREILSDDVCALGMQVANAPRHMAYAKIIDENQNEYSLAV